jgi:hypothetical protein
MKKSPPVEKSLYLPSPGELASIAAELISGGLSPVKAIEIAFRNLISSSQLMESYQAVRREGDTAYRGFTDSDGRPTESLRRTQAGEAGLVIGHDHYLRSLPPAQKQLRPVYGEIAKSQLTAEFANKTILQALSALGFGDGKNSDRTLEHLLRWQAHAAVGEEFTLGIVQDLTEILRFSRRAPRFFQWRYAYDFWRMATSPPGSKAVLETRSLVSSPASRKKSRRKRKKAH